MADNVAHVHSRVVGVVVFLDAPAATPAWGRRHVRRDHGSVLQRQGGQHDDEEDDADHHQGGGHRRMRRPGAFPAGLTHERPPVLAPRWAAPGRLRW